MSVSPASPPIEPPFNDPPDATLHVGYDAASTSPVNTNSHFEEREAAEASVPRTKRIACIVCRKRKLKCDGTKPRCATCSRLGHTCAYDKFRKKSGPKRGYVKHLESRLAQVETLLKAQGEYDPGKSSDSVALDPAGGFAPLSSYNFTDNLGEGSSQPMPGIGVSSSQLNRLTQSPNSGPAENVSWEVVSMGLDESLPSQEVIDDMNHIYFARVHQALPVIHRPRFLATMNLAPKARPPISLRYAMWTHVALTTPKYSRLAPYFYARARKYAERQETTDYGHGLVTVGYAQAWSLIANYEFKMMYLLSAWMSSGRASRLSHLMGLHRQDAGTSEVEGILPPHQDWSDLEERRRTFWLAFCQDRSASFGTGSPMSIDERDIQTNLPASEEAFINGRPETTPSLAGAMTPAAVSTLSPFGVFVLMACLCGRSISHLNRPQRAPIDRDSNHEFWKRHRDMDDSLTKTFMSLPVQLRLPAGINDPLIVFVNTNIHAAAIYLHQAAIAKAEKGGFLQQIVDESRMRSQIAAAQIVNIMRMAKHLDPCTMPSFIGYCLYIAARVFVQYLKQHKDDDDAMSSLRFLLATLQRLKAHFPLAESFLVQIDVDLQRIGLQLPAGDYSVDSAPLQVSSARDSFGHLDRDQENYSEDLDVRIPQVKLERMPMRMRRQAQNPTSNSGLGPHEYRPHSDGLAPGHHDPSRSPPPNTAFPTVPSTCGPVPQLGHMNAPVEALGNQVASRLSDPSQQTSSTLPSKNPSQPILGLQADPSMAPPTLSTVHGFSNQREVPSSYTPGYVDASTMGPDARATAVYGASAAWEDVGAVTEMNPVTAQFNMAGTTDHVQNWQPTYAQMGHGWTYPNWSGAQT